MRFFLIFCLVIGCLSRVASQENLQFTTSRNTIKLPFKLVNNLIILPIKVNGVELNFLLDTGVKETILFSLDEKKEILLQAAEEIKLKGLGVQYAIAGLKSVNNTLSVSGLNFLNQEIIVVMDQDFNFSAALGVEVNGIIGYHFFSHILAKIDYHKKKIIIYKTGKYEKNKITKHFESFDFSLENAKPYISTRIKLGNRNFEAKCLVDSGNSDGLWLFPTSNQAVVVPENNFEDYLGRGFSGDIYGKKAKVNQLSLGMFQFNNVVSAFPDSASVANINMVDKRVGSIGGDVLRRFTVIFDYQNQALFLQKNSFYAEKFLYNTSGITLHHVGVQWYQEEIPVKGIVISQENSYKTQSSTDLKYNFKLLPVYEILNIRPNSPAAIAGLKAGDVLLSVNGSKVYQLSLDRVNKLLKADNNKFFNVVISRNGLEISYQFRVIDLL